MSHFQSHISNLLQSPTLTPPSTNTDGCVSSDAVSREFASKALIGTVCAKRYMMTRKPRRPQQISRWVNPQYDIAAYIIKKVPQQTEHTAHSKRESKVRRAIQRTLPGPISPTAKCPDLEPKVYGANVWGFGAFFHVAMRYKEHHDPAHAIISTLFIITHDQYTSVSGTSI